MSLEPQAGAQNGLPVENPTSIISIGERSLMDVWRVLMKQRLIVVAVTLLSVAAAAWHAFRTLPVYQTSSRIEIKSNSGGNGPESFWAAEDPTTELQTEVEVIKSDTVLFQAAQSINLIRMVRQNPAGEAASSAPITSDERGAMVGIMKGGLSVTIIPDTRILEISYSGNDPKLAAEIVNGLVDTYSDEGLRVNFERTAHVSDWLAKQLDSLKEDAAQSQQQLADYQRAHNIVGTDENSNLTLETLNHISGSLDEAEADRIMKESRMRDFNAMNPDMEALMGDDPTIAALYTQLTTLQTQRAQLATKFGPKHPAMQQMDLEIGKVQAQIAKEAELARKQVEAEYQAAVQLEDALRGRLGAQEDAAYKLNEDVAQYSMLRHQAELTRNLYDTLQTNLKEATISAGMSAANITVVDRADVPTSPVAPKKNTIMLMGLVGGLVIGCVLAFVIESIDDRLRTSEEVENASQLPSLAAIPHISSGPAWKKGEGTQEAVSGSSRDQQHNLIALWDPKSNGAEAYRSMRSSLLLSSIDNPPRVIVVTSSFPGGGQNHHGAESCGCSCAKRRACSAGGRRSAQRKSVSRIRDSRSGPRTVDRAHAAGHAHGPASSAAGIADSVCSAHRPAAAEPGRNAFLQSHGGANAAMDTAVRQDRDRHGAFACGFRYAGPGRARRCGGAGSACRRDAQTRPGSGARSAVARKRPRCRRSGERCRPAAGELLHLPLRHVCQGLLVRISTKRNVFESSLRI